MISGSENARLGRQRNWLNQYDWFNHEIKGCESKYACERWAKR